MCKIDQTKGKLPGSRSFGSNWGPSVMPGNWVFPPHASRPTVNLIALIYGGPRGLPAESHAQKRDQCWLREHPPVGGPLLHQGPWQQAAAFPKGCPAPGCPCPAGAVPGGEIPRRKSRTHYGALLHPCKPWFAKHLGLAEVAAALCFSSPVPNSSDPFVDGSVLELRPAVLPAGRTGLGLPHFGSSSWV